MSPNKATCSKCVSTGGTTVVSGTKSAREYRRCNDSVIQLLLFDLDDTLYLESDFVASGYRAVARYLSERYDCCFETVFYTMMAVFAGQGRRMVFPVVIERFLNPSVAVSELVEVYRCHTPSIRLLPGYLRLLKSLHRHYHMGVITDGLPQVQQRKVNALGLAGVMDKILFTWEYGSECEKPHPLSFQLMMEQFGVLPGNTLFIGDNPWKDCAGARRLGIRSVHVQSPGLPGHTGDPVGAPADYVISSLLQLPPILQQ